MRLAICTFLLASSSLFGQYTEPTVAPEQLPWQATKSEDFSVQGAELIEHVLRDHDLVAEAKQLHEWHHQTIEALRPGGASAFIVIEATESDFANWPAGDEIRRKGWKVIRKPMRANPVSFVVLDKTHYSQRGMLTIASLNRFWTQHSNRKAPPPIKSSRARWVTKITMFTRQPCEWCDKWITEDYPQARRDGVNVEFVTDNGGAVPRFEVCTSDSCRVYVGYKSYTAMKAAIQ